MTSQEKAQQWLSSNIDEDFKQEIHNLLNGPKEALEEAFYKDLDFGTGGLRGVMGVGSNRINKYTIAMATQGLANYLIKSFPNEPISVAVAYDCRNNSDFLAQITANVFSANGIKVYFFESLRPTPQLSFAVRHYNCKSGVVITASHNPKEYNGYKAYWEDGAQITPPHDVNVITEVQKISSLDQIKYEPDNDKIVTISEAFDKLFIDKLVDISLDKEVIKKQHDLNIVFSSIHGTGITLVPRALEALGFTNVNIVQEQAEPNGDFPTVVYPNPEESEALTMALKQAEATNADIVMATDPDADRVGVAVKDSNGKFQLINGNQTACLLIYYILEKHKATGTLNPNQYIVKTIVTTDLIDKMCASYNVDCFNTLTGFKFIAVVLKELEGKREFIGGGEESYGYLTDDFVRDKDAVGACTMIAEMAADAKNKGMSLLDMMDEMHSRFGYYKEQLISITKKGKSGAEEIQSMMKNLRQSPPALLAGSKLVSVKDYNNSIERNLITGQESVLDFPESNVLQFITEDGSKISARPSGTEPKIKFYFSVNRQDGNRGNSHSIMKSLDEKIQTIIKDLKL